MLFKRSVLSFFPLNTTCKEELLQIFVLREIEGAKMITVAADFAQHQRIEAALAKADWLFRHNLRFMRGILLRFHPFGHALFTLHIFNKLYLLKAELLHKGSDLCAPGFVDLEVKPSARL